MRVLGFILFASLTAMLSKSLSLGANSSGNAFLLGTSSAVSLGIFLGIVQRLISERLDQARVEELYSSTALGSDFSEFFSEPDLSLGTVSAQQDGHPHQNWTAPKREYFYATEAANSSMSEVTDYV
jgi:hypothetical protein